MGVGVFSSDFDSTGSTFIISPPFMEYEEYLDVMVEEFPHLDIKESPDGGQWSHAIGEGLFDTRLECMQEAFMFDESVLLDEESFVSEGDTNFYHDMKETIRDAVRSLDIDDGAGSRMKVDSDFNLVAGNSTIEVGLRGWESDYIVGVAAGRKSESIIHSGSDVDSIYEHGMSPTLFANTYAQLASHVEEYVRLHVMENGLECRFRTSGYTTSEYKAPEDINKSIDALKTSIQAILVNLNASSEDNIKSADIAERALLIKAIVSDGDKWNGPRIYVPILNKSEGNKPNVVWFSYGDEELVASSSPDETLNIDEFDVTVDFLERNEHSNDWLNARQEKYLKNSNNIVMVVTAGELSNALDEDIEYVLEMDDGEDIKLNCSRIGTTKSLGL